MDKIEKEKLADALLEQAEQHERDAVVHIVSAINCREAAKKVKKTRRRSTSMNPIFAMPYGGKKQGNGEAA
jgi:hypothetical protein